MQRSVKLILTTSLLLFNGHISSAQDLDFLVANTSLEQIIASRRQLIESDLQPANYLNQPASTGVILQGGSNNRAANFIIESGSSAAASLQVGDDNRALLSIVNSPDSQIGSAQIGNDNAMDLAIVGGSENVLSAAQIGTGSTLDVALVNSVGTTITYGQLGQGVRGSVTFINGAPGTNIRLGGRSPE